MCWSVDQLIAYRSTPWCLYTKLFYFSLRAFGIFLWMMCETISVMIFEQGSVLIQLLGLIKRTSCCVRFFSYVFPLLSFLLTFFLVEDIQLCLKYNIKKKLNMYSVWHNYLFILLLFLLLATSSDLKRPSSGQYLQKKKNLKMLVCIIQKHKFYWILFTFISSLYSCYCYYLGTAVAQWLRCCATNR